jgi:hypothetical protein
VRNVRPDVDLARLASVELAIDAVAHASDEEVASSLGRLSAAILSYCHSARETVVSWDEVFDRVRSRESKRFLAMCLLRLASIRRDLFDDGSIRVPAVKLILDEFDELPPAIFGADDLARGFFNTLRALSNRRNVGTILIGGEKMEFALAMHGDALNKFREERVDFVGFESDLGDFAASSRALTGRTRHPR